MENVCSSAASLPRLPSDSPVSRANALIGDRQSIENPGRVRRDSSTKSVAALRAFLLVDALLEDPVFLCQCRNGGFPAFDELTRYPLIELEHSHG
jgi:hypothetical protein